MINVKNQNKGQKKKSFEHILSEDASDRLLREPKNRSKLKFEDIQ